MIKNREFRFVDYNKLMKKEKITCIYCGKENLYYEEDPQAMTFSIFEQCGNQHICNFK